MIKFLPLGKQELQPGKATWYSLSQYCPDQVRTGLEEALGAQPGAELSAQADSKLHTELQEHNDKQAHKRSRGGRSHPYL